jgi:hypothetical protein
MLVRGAVGAGVLALIAAACAGSSPEDAPGCPQTEQRCDGPLLLQTCQLNPVKRRSEWYDVVYCDEFGPEFVCGEREREDGSVTADCVEDADAGAEP